MSQHPGKGDHEHRDGSTIEESGHEDRDGRTMDEEQITNDSCGTS